MQLYETTKKPSLGLWATIIYVYDGSHEKFKENLNHLRKEFSNTIYLAFLYYIEALHAYLIQDFEKYKDCRENCYNFVIVHNTLNHVDFLEFYRLILQYMLEIDAYYLRSTYILSLAREKTRESLNINEILNDRINLAHIYNTIGNIELDRGNMQLAHQIFLKAEAIAKKIKLDRILAHIEGSIGEIYSQMGHFEEAIFWYKKSLKAIQKWSHDKRSLYVIHSYFAEVYFAKDEPEKAKTEMEKVLKILKESGFHDCLMKMKFVEILLYLDHLTEAERKLLEIDQEKKQKFLPTQNAYYMFLLGFLE
ncbi:MAG: tetratricopeptide repeat protein, partial [Candidatus Heimdallarchaeaceae archaeon]